VSGVVPQGYRATVLRVTASDGTTRELCVLVAETEAQRSRGLMDVDSLGGYDGMLFHFDEPVTAEFYMYKTRLPLSIAFFAQDGRFASAADMAPCAEGDSARCPRYGADAAYGDALEVAQGHLGSLRIGAGSTLATGGTCRRA
jgi:uncharacterized membrane protein (UPF0127 family)